MIGFDIGSKYAKICQVERRGDKYFIKSALVGTLPAATDNPKRDNDALITRLKGILKTAVLTEKVAASSVGDSQIVARNFSFPELSPEELQGAIRLEAGQSIFSDLNAMYTDYQVLDNTDKDKLDVLFVAVPRVQIDQRLDLMQRVGLFPDIIDIDNLALVNSFLAFEPSPDTESVVIVDIGHTYSNISVVGDGKLRFVRNVNFGGKDITNEIASYFGISQEMAEEIKKQPALWPEIGLNVKNILRKSMPDLLEAIYRSVEYCMSRKRLINVDKILLTGGTSCMQGIEGFVAEVLGIYTEKWNPIAGYPFKDKAKKQMGCFLSVALGLALRRENNA